ncbi:hypothetical protein ACRE1G_02460, partial [Streptococcus pneumoniae]
KTDFYRPEYQKRKDKICPFSSLAFFQPTTVDKEPQIFETALLEVKDEIGLNSYELTEYNKMK